MQIYSIFEPASGPVRPDDPRNVIFLKEGFSWPAMFVPLPWMLYHRMWLVAAGYVGLSAVTGMLGQLAGQQEAPAVLIGIGFGLIVAFEASGLRRWHLQRTGYRQVATIAEKNLPLAEARYFAGRQAQPSAPPVTMAPEFAPPVPARRLTPGWGFMAPDQRR